MKWCSGPCGRELPVEFFYWTSADRHGRRYRQGMCRWCCRVYKREWARGKYRRDPKFRAYKKAADKAYRAVHRERLNRRRMDRHYARKAGA